MKTVVRIATALAVIGMLAGSAGPLLAQQKVVVEEREAVVLKKVANTVIVRNDKGEIKRYDNIPGNATLYIDGKPAKIEDLREGMKVHAIRFQDVAPPTVITMAEVEQTPAAAPAKPVAAPASATAAAAPAAAPAAEPAAEPARALPTTASPWPMIAVLGVVLALGGLSLTTSARRRAD
ncbi:MAG TPA: hypothetical protein VFS60_02910 [Thermoanaerobaculia bacterium]|nr:hypothetical protein [Thermoanaerobaculia bacterium]